MDNIRQNIVKNNYVFILLLLIIIGGVYRFNGISEQHSYWNDESHTALFSRSILTSGFPTSPIGVGMGIYQIALYYITALTFKLFGVTEFAGRLPSVIAGTTLVAVIFIVAKRLIGERVALAAAFLMTFSQMQLAWSTQLRPYIWMEFFTLLVIFWAYECMQKNYIISRGLIFAVTASVISLLFHGTGIYNFVIIGSVFFTQIIRLKKWKYLSLLAGFFLIALYIISQTPFFSADFLLKFNTYTIHYRVFFTHNYLWLIFGAGIGFIYLLLKRNYYLAILLMGSISFIVLFSLFKVNDRYVRYSITAFPLLYILFGIGVTNLSELRLFKNKILNKFNKNIVNLVIFILLISFAIYKEKIILFPQKYYSINADMRENPIVDYKTAFAKIEDLIKYRENIIVLDAWNDRVPWYLPGQKFIFLVIGGDGKIDPHYGVEMIGTISNFEKVKLKYTSGIVIVENWESMTPPELQDHIRKTLKFEFTQETVPGNEKDPWSISIYSWGL